MEVLSPDPRKKGKTSWKRGARLPGTEDQGPRMEDGGPLLSLWEASLRIQSSALSVLSLWLWAHREPSLESLSARAPNFQTAPQRGPLNCLQTTKTSAPFPGLYLPHGHYSGGSLLLPQD